MPDLITAAGESPASVPPGPNLLETWGVTTDQLSEILLENPSVRGNVFGFIAEYKLKHAWLLRPEITDLKRPHSYDRSVKCDFVFRYRETEIKLEVKCLDAPKVRFQGGVYEGQFQCNGSDSRPITLPNGEILKTNCLLVGEFDVLAVCLFAFDKTWRFAFALNEDLPRNTFRRYTVEQRQYLFPSSMKISWPLRPPFVDDPFILFDRVMASKAPIKHST